jgi:hypothetical protein
MSLNIAGFGSRVYFIATGTFPVGFFVESFADNVNPVEFDDIETAELVMGVNGNTARFNKPAIINMSVSVLPTSAADKSLSILLQANTVGKNSVLANDEITANVYYSNGEFTQLNDGIIVGGKPGYTISSEGRFETMTYKFQFSGYSFV